MQKRRCCRNPPHPLVFIQTPFFLVGISRKIATLLPCVRRHDSGLSDHNSGGSEERHVTCAGVCYIESDSKGFPQSHRTPDAKISRFLRLKGCCIAGILLFLLSCSGVCWAVKSSRGVGKRAVSSGGGGGVIKMDRFLIRKSSGEDKGSPQKKPKLFGEDVEVVGSISRKEPLVFASWNANSIGNRFKNKEDKEAIRSFLDKHKPDMFTIQEVRLPAQCRKGAKKNDDVPRDRTQICQNDKKGEEEVQVYNLTMRSPTFSSYKGYLTLANWRYAGTQVMIKKDVMEPKITYNLDGKGHHPEGRVIICEFPSGLTVLSTYAPNNGNKAESFKRRQDWDKSVNEWVTSKKEEGKKVIWMGDLNVAHAEPDVTHPSWFAEQDMTDGTASPDDIGQPGYSVNERKRFTEILAAGDLVDAFRHMHPVEQPPVDKDGKLDVDGPWWTWRGTPSESDRYYKRGMRIDYTCVSRSLVPRIHEAVIIGKSHQKDNFMGSDHCPVVLRLKPEEEAAANPAQAEAGPD